MTKEDRLYQQWTKANKEALSNLRYLHRHLPKDSVRIRFTTEADRAARLQAIRWPNGVSYLKCAGKSVIALETRSVFQCCECRKQFSVTNGTVLHRTHLTLGTWFEMTEEIIWSRGDALISYITTTRELRQFRSQSYETVWHLRKRILSDLAQGRASLLARAVCDLPPHTPEVTAEELGTGFD